jgi:hypothetical protein
MVFSVVSAVLRPDWKGKREATALLAWKPDGAYELVTD